MLSKDFEAGTDVVKRKIKQVRALNHVVKTMRGKIQDLDLDPVELKVDRNQWRHEAKALKLQVAKLKEDRDHWEHQANFFRLERDELKVRVEELENNKPNNADEGYDDDVVMDDQEVDAVEGNGQVEEVGECQGVGIEGHGVGIEGNGVGIEGNGVGIEGSAVFIEENEFELFLKFRKFLAAEGDVSHQAQPISQLAQPLSQLAQPIAQPTLHPTAQPLQDRQGGIVDAIKQAVVVEGCQSFVTLPDGRVVEVVDAGPF